MAREARLNVQGLARRDRGLLGCILPDLGYVTVSMDLSSGEPTITSEFSKDPNYYAACFGMVGKKPYYAGGILYLDDLYLMVASVSPLGAAAIRDAWNAPWPAGSFADQWVVDSDVIKKKLGELRKIHKVICLALSYGLGAQKMCKQMYEQGVHIDLKTAKAFKESYWRLFAGVKTFGDRLQLMRERQGYIVNPFGYRLVPEVRKSLNFFVQSSVSGLMHVLCAKLFALAPYAIFVTVIHDEIIADCPIDRVEEFREHARLATESLNEDLGWRVKVRTGFVVGHSWYEAK